KLASSPIASTRRPACLAIPLRMRPSLGLSRGMECGGEMQRNRGIIMTKCDIVCEAHSHPVADIGAEASSGCLELPATNVVTEAEIATLEALLPTLEGKPDRQK